MLVPSRKSSEQQTNESTSERGSMPASNAARCAASNISSLYETPAAIAANPACPMPTTATLGSTGRSSHGPGSIVPPWGAGMLANVATSSEGFRRIRWAMLALVVALAYGVSGYMLLQGWPFLDALYMTVTTFTTVGFREVRPL